MCFCEFELLRILQMLLPRKLLFLSIKVSLLHCMMGYKNAKPASGLLEISVTIFGEISPPWEKFTSLWQFFDSLFLIWQNVEPTLANCDIIGLICIVANSQILKNNLTIWSHCKRNKQTKALAFYPWPN